MISMRGDRVMDIVRQYNRSMSTICTLTKKKDETKVVTTAMVVSRLSKQRTYVRKRMEKITSPVDEPEATRKRYDYGDHHLQEST